MIRRRCLLAVALVMSLSTPLPAVAAKTLSIETMEELLQTLRDKPDGKAAGELDDVQLTERVSAARLARWEAQFPGVRTRGELVKLADMSAFLDPPASDAVSSPRPDVKTQLQILRSAAEYVANTIPRLPDFYATRATVHYENDTSQPSFSAGSSSTALLNAGTFTRTVTYRDGKEVSYAGARKLKQEPEQSLTTTGEFGPILMVVVGDALHGSLKWARWERGTGGSVAVFSYSVPQPESHFLVGVAVKSKADGILPAYHGEIAIDQTTGAILRLIQVADMTSPHEGMVAEIAVDYAPVTIAGRSYICPVRGVALSAYPLDGPTGSTIVASRRGVVSIGSSDGSLGPEKTELNDIAFTNYHEFRAEARIVTNASQGEPSNETDGNQAPARDLSAGVSAPATSSPGTPSPSNPAVPVSETVATVPPSPSATPSTETPALNPSAGSSSPNVAPASGADATRESASTPSDATMVADASAAGAVLHTQSNLVLVDIVVTNHGKPVKDLDRARFHVFEDGHEQKIASFDESEPANTSEAVVRPPALPPDTYTNLPAYPNAGAVNVLLLDGLNTEASDQLYVRREMIRYLKTLPAGQHIAIFTLGSKLRLIQGFTSDTARLLAVLAEKKAVALASLRQSAEQKSQDQAELDELTDAEISPQDIANTQDFMGDAEEQQTGMRVDLTLDALQDLARYLSGIPARKNVIWFSGSFPLQFFAIGSSPIEQIRLNAEGLLGEEVRDTADLLAAERIAVYPVDVRGVLGQPMFDASVQAQDYTRPTVPSSIGGGTGRFSQDTQLAALQTTAEHASMDVLAEETGGRAVHDSNGLKEALQDALSDGSSFYSIAYVPPERKNGQSGVVFHSVEVKLDGAKYQLAYRRGYYIEDAKTPAESSGKMPDEMTKAAVLGAPPSTQVLFQARVLQQDANVAQGATPGDDAAGEKSTSFPGGTRRYEVDLNVPLQSLTVAEEKDGARLAQLRSVLVAYTEDGDEVNSVGRAFNFNLPTARYSKLLAEGGAISAHLSLDLPVRDVALRIVVYDPASAKTGSIEIPIPAAGKSVRQQDKSSLQ